jgi:hypothetical protein
MVRGVEPKTRVRMSRRADTDRTERVIESEQPDGRLIVYEGDAPTATETGRWIVGEPVTVTR